MILYFARHAESLANTRRIISNRDLPHPLTANGRDQAQKLAETLANEGINAIYTSPVPRACETAGILAESLSLPIEVSDGLREFDAGVLEGRSDLLAWMRFSSLWNGWFYRRQFDRRIKGGENYREASCRFTGFAERLVSSLAETGARVLCITHGGVLRVGLPGLISNMNFETIREKPIHYTTIIKVSLENGSWYCRGWDEIELNSE